MEEKLNWPTLDWDTWGSMNVSTLQEFLSAGYDPNALDGLL